MAKKKVFVSLDYDNDATYRNMMRAWDANPNFDFEFSETSPKVAIDSTDAAAIKRSLSRMIGDATHLLCIVGKQTSNSNWVCWEIDKAKELKKKLVGIKLDAGNTSPAPLLNAGAAWAMSFTRDAILEALNDA